MPKKILIVDDEILFTESLKGYFEIKGFTVFTAATAEEAFALLNKEKPDIVTLDIVLKGKLDGIDVLKGAKNTSPLSKIIMLTGSDMSSKEKEAHNIGITRFIRKPIPPKDLYNIINEILESPA